MHKLFKITCSPETCKCELWKHISFFAKGHTVFFFPEMIIKSALNCLALPVHLVYQFSMSVVFGYILMLQGPIIVGSESQI